MVEGYDMSVWPFFPFCYVILIIKYIFNMSAKKKNRDDDDDDNDSIHEKEEIDKAKLDEKALDKIADKDEEDLRKLKEVSYS